MGLGGGRLRVPVRSVHEADPSPAWDWCGTAFWCRGPHRVRGCLGSGPPGLMGEAG